MKRTVAIITDDPGWHGARLKEAYEARGFACLYISLLDCRLTPDQKNPVYLPGIELDDLVGVFVRGVPTGSLQEVVFYLDILHALREMGFVVYNDARAIERSVDKAMTSFLLTNCRIPTPATWTVRGLHEAQTLVAGELAAGHILVYKPIFGSQGEGVSKITQLSDLPSEAECGGIYYLQRYIDTGEGKWHDWRVFVIRGKAVAAMRRSGKSWISNVAQGAVCDAAILNDTMRKLAEDAANALNMHYAGIDIIRDHDGVYYVLEVNSVPAWKGLQSTTDYAIARHLVDDFLDHCHAGQRIELAG